MREEPRESQEEGALLQVGGEGDPPLPHDPAEDAENFKNTKSKTAFLHRYEGILVKA